MSDELRAVGDSAASNALSRDAAAPAPSGGDARRIRVGILSDVSRAAVLAAALTAGDDFEIVAQAGMGQPGAVAGVPWFADERVMITQPDVEAVVISLAPDVSNELSLAALTHGAHVWREGPLGRTFAEAVDFARRAPELRPECHLASWWDGVREAVHWALGLTNASAAGGVAAIDCVVHGPHPEAHVWRAQAARGGGPLADLVMCLEVLVGLLGLPDRIQAAEARAAGAEVPASIAALAAYPDGSLANLHSAWGVAPQQESICITRGGVIRISTNGVTVDDEHGRRLDELAAPDPLARDLRDFAAAVRGGASHAALRMERQLTVMAVMEAIRLSARTGQPETPRKFYELQGWPAAPQMGASVWNA